MVQPVEQETTISAFPSNETSIADIPFTKNLFVGFKEAIAHKESRGKYQKVNSFGYLGKYQFGVQTLRAIGVQNHHHF